MSDLDELREKVEQAREPSDWHFTEENDPYEVQTDEGLLLKDDYYKAIRAGQGNGSHEIVGKWGVTNTKDAKFIETFDPETVLALLDRLERYKAALEAIRHEIEAYKSGQYTRSDELGTLRMLAEAGIEGVTVEDAVAAIIGRGHVEVEG